MTDDADADPSALERIKAHSLRTAGIAYLLGDASLFASGMLSGRYKEAMSGAVWGLGGLAAAKYGSPDAEKRLELLSTRLGRYLRKQGVAIPDATDTAILAQKGGLLDRTEEFLYAYPSQTLNTAYAVGAAQLLRSGLQHEKYWDAASGALIGAGALAGLLVPEKAPDPDHPPNGHIAKAASWLQEKPLRISGGLYALNNVTLGVSAFKEMHTNPTQKSYLFKFLTVGSYVFGNAMLAMSSKAHAASDPHEAEALGKLAETSARVIAAQAPPLREALVQRISAYLSSQPEVTLKADDLAGLLHEKLARMPQAQGAWQGRVQENGAAYSPPPF